MDPKVRPLTPTLTLSRLHVARLEGCEDGRHLPLLPTPQMRPSSHFDSPHWTTNSGAPVWNNNNSSTVGVRGE